MGKRAYRLEDYLRRILCLSKKKPVHAADLSRDLEVSRPTVSVFLKQLQRDGYATVGAHHMIMLTPKGMDIAKQTLQRHQTIQLLFCFGVAHNRSKPGSFQGLANRFSIFTMRFPPNPSGLQGV